MKIRLINILPLLILGVFPLVALPVNGQQRQPVVVMEPNKNPMDPQSNPFSSIEEEMKAKRAIKYAEKEYLDNIERARDLSVLSTSIVTSFKQRSALTQDDFKKLEKVEKLAKGIRHAAGGSEDDTEMEKPPTNIASAVSMLGDLSNSLKAKVEKTPKHVISATVIDEANVLLELIRLVRTFSSKGL